MTKFFTILESIFLEIIAGQNWLSWWWSKISPISSDPMECVSSAIYFLNLLMKLTWNILVQKVGETLGKNPVTYFVETNQYMHAFKRLYNVRFYEAVVYMLAKILMENLLLICMWSRFMGIITHPELAIVVIKQTPT